jgi:hypothetical protein
MRTSGRCRLFSTAVVAGVVSAILIPGAARPIHNDEDKPPEDAIVLFDGTNLTGWTSLEGKPASWKVENGYMVVGHRDIRTKQNFGPDFQLHVEFWLPLMKEAKDQARANSGVYLQGRYEVQVLDSYMNPTYKGGECAALYLLIPTKKNANKPPEQWQKYDITFHAPRVDEQGKVTKSGSLTVVFNGETVIDNGEFDKVTGGALDEKIGTPGPIRLQDHGCKVRYRSIWLKPLAGA